MEVQVISSLVPLQRPWEGSKLCRSITGPPTLCASFPLECHFVSDSADFQKHNLHQHPQHSVPAFPESHG